MEVVEEYKALNERVRGSHLARLAFTHTNIFTRCVDRLACKTQRVCSGSKLTSRGRDDKHIITIDGSEVGPLENLNVRKIVLMATPASYGEGSETKTDPSVRKALEIKADRLQKSHFIDHLRQIADDLSFEMFPTQDFSIVPYKMQIYEAGGHFAKHTDTLHAPNHVATLLLMLPVAHAGGELCLTNGSTKQQYFDDPYCQYEMPFVCFFTDMPHEVKPVTSGIRIVVQFEIHVHERNEPTHPGAWFTYRGDSDDFSETSADKRDFADDLEPHEYFGGEGKCGGGDFEDKVEDRVAALGQEFFNELKAHIAKRHNRGEHPGVFLEHMYPLIAMRNGILKGKDLFLNNAFESMGYDVVVAPATVDTEWYYDSDERDTATLKVWDVDWVRRADCCKWTIYALTRVDAFYEQIEYRDAVCYTGNEAEPGNLQVVTGCMVVVPKKVSAAASSSSSSAVSAEVTEPAAKKRRTE